MRSISFLLSLSLLAVLSCVPRTQYEALETERNYYRSQMALADSLADQRAIQSYDQVEPADDRLDEQIQRMEELRATNVALNQSYQSLQARYDELLGQSQNMLNDSGDRVTGLQQSLAERTTLLEQREDELRQLEADLLAREEAIERVEADYAPAGGGQPASYGGSVAAPQAYGTTTARSPLTAGQTSALAVNDVRGRLAQALSGYPRDGYRLEEAAGGRLRLSVNEGLLTEDGYTVSVGGQSLLRALAGALRARSTSVLVVGHADNRGGNALRAYEDSTDKAINVAQQLTNFGMNPRRVTVAGRGFYDPVTNGITEADLAANRRTEFIVTVQD